MPICQIDQAACQLPVRIITTLTIGTNLQIMTKFYKSRYLFHVRVCLPVRVCIHANVHVQGPSPYAVSTGKLEKLANCGKIGILRKKWHAAEKLAYCGKRISSGVPTKANYATFFFSIITLNGFPWRTKMATEETSKKKSSRTSNPIE
jgi:hypothetical protein